MDSDATEERFWSRVDKGSADECWLWTGGLVKKRYGNFQLPEQQWLAHRFAWTLVFGEIPDGLCVCHRCDNPPCVNPDHLFLGTHTDNMRDCIAKGRMAHGERVGGAKLTPQKVRQMRGLYDTGTSVARLSRMFGVVSGTVCYVVHRRHWKHVS